MFSGFEQLLLKAADSIFTKPSLPPRAKSFPVISLRERLRDRGLKGKYSLQAVADNQPGKTKTA